MDFAFLAQTVLSGAAAGGIYALIAIGFGLIYRTTRVFNFAQGDFGGLGAYVAFTVIVTMQQSIIVGLIVGCVAVGILAVVVERLALRPLYKRGELYTFISTIGLGFAIQSAIQYIWGPIVKTMPTYFGNQGTDFIGLRIVPEVVWVLFISLALAGVLYFLLTHTKVGTAMRACAQDRQVAGLLGINVNVMFTLAFFMAGAVGALAGILIAPINYLRPTMGLGLGLPGYIAALLGGLGSMPGAIVGGLVLGILQSTSVFFINPQYKDLVAYAILVLIIIVRPSGLFGEEQITGRQV